MQKKKLLTVAVIGLLAASITAAHRCNSLVAANARGKMYFDVDSIPQNKVGLLLGATKTLHNGAENPFYTNRIAAAVELYKAGKIKYIIASGDNSRQSYNEPEQMRHDLVAAGVDSTRVYCDYAGFRTFDSVVRLKDVFGQDTVTIISQQFHNERALYIASHEGISAIAFNAPDVNSKFNFAASVREKFARVKVFVDFMVGKKPHFLGHRIVIS